MSDREEDLNRIEKTFNKLIEEIKKCNSPKDTAEYCMFELVNQTSKTHCEALGIFTEAMLNYREVATKVMEEESETTNGVEGA